MNEDRISPEIDPMGRAIQDYYKTGTAVYPLIVYSSISEEDEIPVQYLWRTYDEMPELERMALNLCKGYILDVGAGAGSHSLYLQKKNLKVDAIEISTLACEVMRQRGLKNVIHQDFFTYSIKKYDTLLLLMNGIGISGTMSDLPSFFKQCELLLNEKGQVLIDSSDLIYMFDNEEEIKKEAEYYGEVNYQLSYGNTVGKNFNWLFIDFITLEKQAKKNGWLCERIFEDDHFAYLARLTKKQAVQ